MKTKLATLLLTLSVTLTHANLIDLTPGGYGGAVEPPPVDSFVRQLGLGPLALQFLAGAGTNTGVPVWSPFTIFNTDHFGITLNPGDTSAEVSWDLTGVGYFLQYILVESRGPGDISNLYAVGGRTRTQGNGSVEIDGIQAIDAGITFAGRPLSAVPENGGTLMLFMLGAGFCFAGRKVLGI